MKHIYADDILDLQLNATAVRFTLVQRNTEGGFTPVAKIVLPAVSAPEVFKAMSDGLANAATTMMARRKDADATS
jgi:hypothetical protein